VSPSSKAVVPVRSVNVKRPSSFTSAPTVNAVMPEME
jgi:hypothetical protein